jgi:hypothetical protein
MEDRTVQSEVDRFIMDRIDSVPHLEALLLMWRDRGQTSSAGKLAGQLWLNPEVTNNILEDLERLGFLERDKSAGEYRYSSDPETDRLVGLLNETYKRELIRVSTMIHSKASPAVREFAKAFRLKKDE